MNDRPSTASMTVQLLSDLKIICPRSLLGLCLIVFARPDAIGEWLTSFRSDRVGLYATLAGLSQIRTFAQVGTSFGGFGRLNI